MKRILFALLMLLPLAAFSQVSVENLPNGSSIVGGNYTICDQSGVTNKCTINQVLAYIQAQMNLTAIPTLINGDCLSNNGTILLWTTCGSGGGGTVTSVNLTVPAFLSISGCPITGSGTCAISYSGSALPVANGGNGTTTPALIAGSNITLTGSWPNYTINATGSSLSTQANNTLFGNVSGTTAIPGPLTPVQTFQALYSAAANAQTGTSYTFTLADQNGVVTSSNAASQAITVPPNSSVAYPVGTLLTLVEAGAGIPTLSPASGVTICSVQYGCSTSQTYALAGLNDLIQLRQTATNTWLVTAVGPGRAAQAGTVNLASTGFGGVINILPVANGGSGTASPAIIAGTNVTVTGTWPNQTVNATGGGSTAFSALTSGTNTTMAAVCGTGCSIGVSGSGANVATSVPVAGVTGLGTGVATFLATPSSANLATAVTGETGTGALVFGTSPTLVTPALGTPASGVATNLTGTATALNIGGTAANLSGTPALPNGTTATTQTVGDNTTKLATTAFVLANASSSGVSSAAAGGGIVITGTGAGPFTGAITVAASYTPRVVAGTTDTILSTDCANGVQYTSASAVAVTLPQATGSFATCNFDVYASGAGAVTVTPTTSTITNNSSLTGTSLVVPSRSTANITALSGNYLAGGPAVAGTGSSGVTSVTCGTGLTGGTITTTGTCALNAGTGVAAAVAANLSAAGGLTSTIASGTSALGTGAIASGACATVVTTTATNVATTDAINWSFNADPTAVTGYSPSANGMLTIISYPTSGNVNWKVCNNTASSVTPGAITLNWRVVR